MKVVFVAGPYRADTDDERRKNIDIAAIAARAVWKHGGVALCPHKNSEHFSGIVKEKRFLQGYLELLSRCDCVLTVPGWENSKGAQAEVALAKEIGLPVFHFAAQVDTWIEQADEDLGP
jgi:hypothetical protein